MAEYIAALILYGIFYYVITTFANKLSYKKIHKEIFSLHYQIFFWVGFILFFIFVEIEDHSTFASIMKMGMGFLIIIDILFYLFSKFSDYPFGWAIFSIILDILAIPVVIIVFLLAAGVASSSYSNCYWWCNDD